MVFRRLSLLLALATLSGTAVTLAQRAPAPAPAPAPATGLLASFETEADNPFEVRDNVTVARVQEHATDGRWALRVTGKGSEQPSWPAL